MYDAIIVGGRVSGAALSMLLARAGHRVLCVERDPMPSDTLSTHYLHPMGVARLKRWGLLDALEQTGCPRITRFEAHRGGQVTLEPFSRDANGQLEYALCPRRDILDGLLWQAATEAGAEMRDRVRVTDLVTGEAGAVSGIEARGRRGGATITEEARVVIGADGVHSFVAEQTQPQTYLSLPPLLCSYYSYWSGVPAEGVETYFQPGAALLLFPTHNGQVNIGAAWPAARFPAVRKDVEAVFLDTLRKVAPDLADRAAAGTREEPFRGTRELPFYRRVPFGPGWALVGDAGAAIDSTLGLGITKAFAEAEQMSIALDFALSGKQPFEVMMRQYHAARDRDQDRFLQQNLAASSYIAGSAG
jgi:2-polyprenyl-6-methoxyphenol hydroxylase-like FAD-dependent oxidoreductase